MKRTLAVFLPLLLAACQSVQTVPVQSVPARMSDSLLVDARKFLVYDFKDPDSAKFRQERTYRLGNGDYAVCGQVNGRNSFGAYIGFKTFYVRISPDGAGKMRQTEFLADVACKQAASGTVRIRQ